MLSRWLTSSYARGISHEIRRKENICFINIPLGTLEERHCSVLFPCPGDPCGWDGQPVGRRWWPLTGDSHPPGGPLSAPFVLTSKPKGSLQTPAQCLQGESLPAFLAGGLLFGFGLSFDPRMSKHPVATEEESSSVAKGVHLFYTLLLPHSLCMGVPLHLPFSLSFCCWQKYSQKNKQEEKTKQIIAFCFAARGGNAWLLFRSELKERAPFRRSRAGTGSDRTQVPRDNKDERLVPLTPAPQIKRHCEVLAVDFKPVWLLLWFGESRMGMQFVTVKRRSVYSPDGMSSNEENSPL